jgi:hypothetical protein
VAAADLTPPVNRYLLLRDVELGAEAAEELRKQVPLLADDVVQRYVGELGGRLVDSLPENLRQRTFHFSFEVLNRNDVAAFALPGGPVFMTRGMIDVATSEDELAALLAHEVSHVVLRHATAQASIGEEYLAGAVSGRALGAAAAGRGVGILAQGSSLGLASYFLMYGHEYERQADFLAVGMLARAGYDPTALATMFRTISSEDTERGGPQWVRGHPDPADSEQRTDRDDFIVREAKLLRREKAASPHIEHAADTWDARTAPPSRRPLDAIHARLAANPIRTTPNIGGVRQLRIGKAAYSVASPSGEGKVDTVAHRWVLGLPINWQRVLTGTAVTFAPEGALQTVRGTVGLTHGVQVGVARSVANNLPLDLEALLQRLGQTNPHMRWTAAFQHSAVAGRKGLTTTLANVSAITGEVEQVSVAAAHLPDGNLLYVIGVAPQDESGVYRRVFMQVAESIRVTR